MATDNSQRDAATEGTEMGTQDNATEQNATDETSGQATGSTEDNGTATSNDQANGGSATGGSQSTGSVKEQELLGDLVKERERRKALSAEVEQLKANGSTAGTELQSAKDELTTVQRKYDRLESFLTGVGGPLSKALDSKSFTTALFDSEDEIDDIVAKWNKDNPSATGSALNSGAGTVSRNSSMNDLLRQAAR